MSQRAMAKKKKVVSEAPSEPTPAPISDPIAPAENDAPEIDRRVPEGEQPVALAIAEAEGVLPEEDRREPEPEPEPVVEVAEPVAEAAPVVEAPVVVAENIPSLMDGQPLGSFCEYIGGRWNFYRGGSRNAHGQGKTLARAIQAVNSRYEIRDNRQVLVDESGEPLPPE